MALSQYIKETRAEMKHVTWPSRRQALAYSVLVVLISVAISLYLGFFDALFTQGIKLFVGGN